MSHTQETHTVSVLLAGSEAIMSLVDDYRLLGDRSHADALFDLAWELTCRANRLHKAVI